jgi:hypothetical protein
MASTAEVTVEKAVIRITAVSRPISRMRRSTSTPSVSGSL